MVAFGAINDKESEKLAAEKWKNRKRESKGSRIKKGCPTTKAFTHPFGLVVIGNFFSSLNSWKRILTIFFSTIVGLKAPYFYSNISRNLLNTVSLPTNNTIN